MPHNSEPLTNQIEPLSYPSCLQHPTLSPQSFFSIQGIVALLKKDIRRFISYCKRHKEFTVEMIKLCLHLDQAEIEQKKLQKVVYAIGEIICSGEDGISDLFFNLDQKEQQTTLKNESEVSEDLEGQEEQIVTEARRLLQPDPQPITQELNQQLTKPINLGGHQAMKQVLSALRKEPFNISSLCFIQRLFSYLLRCSEYDVLEFLQRNEEYLNLLIGKMEFIPIGSLLVQILTVQDDQNSFPFANLKECIIEGIVRSLFEKISDELFYDGIVVLVENLLKATKKTYQNPSNHFLIPASRLYSKDTVSRLLEMVGNGQSETAYNSTRLLQIILKEKMQVGLQLLPPVVVLQWISSLEGFEHGAKVKLCLLNLVHEAFRMEAIPKEHELLPKYFQKMAKLMSSEKHAGLIKSRMFYILEEIVKRLSAQQKIAAASQEKFFESYFPHMLKTNQINQKQYNKDESIGFQAKILILLAAERQEINSLALKILKKNISKFKRKYEARIANFDLDSKDSETKELNFSFSLNFNQRNNKDEDNQTLLDFKLSLPPQKSFRQKHEETGQIANRQKQREKKEQSVAEHQVSKKVSECSKEKTKFFIRHLQLFS